MVNHTYDKIVDYKANDAGESTGEKPEDADVRAILLGEGDVVPEEGGEDAPGKRVAHEESQTHLLLQLPQHLGQLVHAD